MPQICCNSWTFAWQDSSPIASSAETDSLSCQFPFPLPGIIFPNNFIRISNPNVLLEPLVFSLPLVLKGIALEPSPFAVATAKTWKPSVEGIPAFSRAFDWTFFSRFVPQVSLKESKIPADFTELLQCRKDPILGYSECRLFEDELADNGHSEYFVKLRIMPKCFLCLATMNLRVDHVCTQSLETRISADYHTALVIKTTEKLNGKIVHEQVRSFEM
jgi:hypothetical protein